MLPSPPFGLPIVPARPRAYSHALFPCFRSDFGAMQASTLVAALTYKARLHKGCSWHANGGRCVYWMKAILAAALVVYSIVERG